MDVYVKTVHNLLLTEHALKFVPRMLSVRWNRFLICSVCDKIVSTDAQDVNAIIFKNYWKIPNKMQILTINNQNFEKPSRNPSNRPKWKFWEKIFLDSSPKKFGSAYAQSPRKCLNMEILAKIKGKESKNLFLIDQGHIRFWFMSRKIQNYLMLVYL